MRYITLKVTKTRKGSDFVYAKQIDQIVSEMLITPQGNQVGFDVATMRKAFRVVDAVEAVQFGNVLKLEEADWEFLKNRVAAFQWPWADRAFAAFCDAIEGAPKEAPAEVPDTVESAAEPDAPNSVN